MTNPADASEVVPYLTSAAAIVYVQKWLKTRPAYATFVQAFPGADKYAHWCIAAAGSVVVAAGIHWTYNYSAEAGGTIAISIPSLMSVLHGLGDWLKTYLLQHTVYEATKQPPYVPPPTQGA